MELSRDLSIIVVQIYHLDRDYPLSFCDALAATGARGIRIAKEVRGIWRVVLNDLNSLAVEFIKLNVSQNRLDHKVLVRRMDANLLLSSSFFDIVGALYPPSTRRPTCFGRGFWVSGCKTIFCC